MPGPQYQAAALNGVRATFDWMSLHTGSPGNTGVAELTAAPRQRTTWQTPEPPEATGSEVVFAVGGTMPVTVTHVGVWDSQTGGAWGTGAALPEPFTFETAGNYRLTPTLAFEPA
jgi:hypothetical protein